VLRAVRDSYSWEMRAKDFLYGPYCGFANPVRLILADIPADNQQTYRVFARCSDPNVICDTYDVAMGEPHDVNVKVSSLQPTCSRTLSSFLLSIHSR
jgi:hypothetical protein